MGLLDFLKSRRKRGEARAETCLSLFLRLAAKSPVFAGFRGNEIKRIREGAPEPNYFCSASPRSILASRNAERLTFPASSRRCLSTNSMLRGIL